MVTALTRKYLTGPRSGAYSRGLLRFATTGCKKSLLSCNSLLCQFLLSSSLSNPCLDVVSPSPSTSVAIPVLPPPHRTMRARARSSGSIGGARPSCARVGDVPDTWITDDMRALIGREFGEEQVSAPISLSDIKKWAIAIYYPELPPRLFWDEAYAATTVHGGIVAPEEFNPFAWFTAEGPRIAPSFEGPIRDAGPERAFGVAPPETNFILNGGIEVTYGVRMRPGDVITSSRSKVVEYKERQSRLGLMLMTTTETTWTNQNAEMVKITRGTLIRY